MELGASALGVHARLGACVGLLVPAGGAQGMLMQSVMSERIVKPTIR